MMADELHRAFDELLELEHVVVFIDEVDDIASSRTARPETQRDKGDVSIRASRGARG